MARSNAQLGGAEIWRVFAPGILTNVRVTATLSKSFSSSMTVVSFTGIDTSGVNGAGAIGATAVRSASSGAPNATLVTTRNNALLFGVGNDWNHAIPRTVGPNQALGMGMTRWICEPLPGGSSPLAVRDRSSFA